MNRDHDHHLEEIFAAATERRSAAERTAYLDLACGDDAELRNRIEALLKAHDATSGILDSPPVSPLAEGPGTRIGPYKLLQLIGEGGFGAVYMAEQMEPVRRRVALKIIKLGMDTKQVIARFEAERQALALLDHPNIARVFDAGATETGRPYFVMELVKGVSLTEYCDKNNLTTRERLELFVAICSAVQHAHQKGLIHRDLKPGNILVTLHDGTPVPKVIDFGIARATNRRLTEKTLFTEYGQFVGTPVYISPEQAEMSGLDIDTRCDIYSLGVILYELLTGTTPISEQSLREAGFAKIQEIIRDAEPPVPSTRLTTLGEELTVVARHRQADPGTLSKAIRGDLDWIVMRAMEKDRTRRYGTASEMASDVKRHLARQPVLAGPPSVIYKLRKFVLRHRFGVLAGLMVAGALFIGLSLAAAGLLKARREAERSQKIADFLQDLIVATDPDQIQARNVDVDDIVRTARDVFGDDHATVAATLSSRAAQLLSAGDLAGAEPLYREAIRIWKEEYGESHLTVAVIQGSLGRLLDLKGDNRGAEAAFRESLKLSAALPESKTVALCDTRISLAVLVLNRGGYDEAEDLIRTALRIRKTWAPQQLTQIALNTNSLVNVLSLAGKSKEALAMFDELLLAWRRALPPGGLMMAKVLGQLGEALRQAEKIERAEPILREAVLAFRQLPECPVVDRFRAWRGLFKIMMARGDDSEEFLQVGWEFLEVTEEFLGTENLDYQSLLGDFATRLDQLGHLDEAMTLLRGSVDSLIVCTSIGSESHLNRLRTLADVIWHIARDPGRPAEEYERAFEAVNYYLDARGPVPAVVNTKGAVLYRLGRYDEAGDALAISDEAHRESMEQGAFEDAVFLALVHHRLGDPDGARAELERMHKIIETRERPADEYDRALVKEAEEVITSDRDE